MKITTLAVALLIGTQFLSAQAGGVVTGSDAPDFTLTDSNGNAHSLADFKGKHVVMEWTNDQCPFVVKHYKSQNMQGLQKKFTDMGVVWLSVCSSAPGKQGNKSPAKWNKQLAKDGSNPSALLIDADGRVGRAYGAKTTPHIFVINSEGKVVYQGAIDNIRSTNPDDAAKADNYVHAALNASLNGELIAVGTTKPYGCGIKY